MTPAQGPEYRRALAMPSLFAAAVLTLSGCSAFEEPDDVVYCVDEHNTVVDEDECDDDGPRAGGSHWYMMGRYPTGLLPGTRLDPALSTNRVATNDSDARSRAGLSGSGSVKTGSSASGKPSGFGSSSSSRSGSGSGSSSSSGSSGSGKSGGSTDAGGSSSGKGGGFGGSGSSGG